MMKKAFLVLAGFSVLSGCSSSQDDIDSWMAEESMNMRGRVQPLPQVLSFPPVDYSGRNGIDPFLTTRIEPEKQATNASLAPDRDRQREPLESFPLESLRYVGSMRKNQELQALIETGTGIYQVKTGNYMGQDYGLITAITDTEITLKELVEDMNGEWVERITAMQIQERGPQEAKKR